MQYAFTAYLRFDEPNAVHVQTKEGVYTSAAIAEYVIYLSFRTRKHGHAYKLVYAYLYSPGVIGPSQMAHSTLRLSRDTAVKWTMSICPDWSMLVSGMLA